MVKMKYGNYTLLYEIFMFNIINIVYHKVHSVVRKSSCNYVLLPCVSKSFKYLYNVDCFQKEKVPEPSEALHIRLQVGRLCHWEADWKRLQCSRV